MVTEFFLNIVFNLVEWLLGRLPEMDITLNFGATSYFFTIVRCVLYMLPVDTIITIVTLIVLIGSFRIFISIGKTIWDLLPISLG